MIITFPLRCWNLLQLMLLLYSQLIQQTQILHYNRQTYGDLQQLHNNDGLVKISSFYEFFQVLRHLPAKQLQHLQQSLFNCNRQLRTEFLPKMCIFQFQIYMYFCQTQHDLVTLQLQYLSDDQLLLFLGLYSTQILQEMLQHF